MLQFELDKGLEEQELHGPSKSQLVKQVTRNYNLDFEKEARVTVDGDTFHKNYLYYLQECYNSHLGYVISPDIFWNIILNELATVVKNDPDRYRDLFTESEEKQNITVFGADPFELPIEDIVAALRKLVPTDVDSFLPEFSTTGDLERQANYFSFADMVSPYYNYMMLLCGFPSVRILGTSEDWARFIEGIDFLIETFDNETITSYLNTIEMHIGTIAVQYNEEFLSEDFFQNIFSLEPCGSGSQVELNGWIRDFFIEQPSIPYLENFSSLVGSIDYKYLPTNKEYTVYSGLFSSVVEDGFLIPSFGKIVTVKQEQEKASETLSFI